MIIYHQGTFVGEFDASQNFSGFVVSPDNTIASFVRCVNGKIIKQRTIVIPKNARKRVINKES